MLQCVCVCVCVCARSKKGQRSKYQMYLSEGVYYNNLCKAGIVLFLKLITVVSPLSVHLSLTKMIFSSISQCVHIRLVFFLYYILITRLLS